MPFITGQPYGTCRTNSVDNPILHSHPRIFSYFCWNRLHKRHDMHFAGKFSGGTLAVPTLDLSYVIHGVVEVWEFLFPSEFNGWSRLLKAVDIRPLPTSTIWSLSRMNYFSKKMSHMMTSRKKKRKKNLRANGKTAISKRSKNNQNISHTLSRERF